MIFNAIFYSIPFSKHYQTISYTSNTLRSDILRRGHRISSTRFLDLQSSKAFLVWLEFFA